MAKAPPNIPQPGDRVRLRGRPPKGYLRHVDERQWSWVWWDVENSAPKITHLYELERVPDDD